MDAFNVNWDTIEPDHPIALLTRQMVKGEKALVARIELAKGCHVAHHHHVSEQISVHVSGEVLWHIGEPGSPEYRDVVMRGGDVLVLPSYVYHSVDVLKDSLIFDIITPIGPMGVDSQRD